MREMRTLLAPAFWAIRNDILRLHGAFYKKLFLLLSSGALFIYIITRMLNMGMSRLRDVAPEVFHIMLIKGFSLIFIILFFILIIDGFITSLNRLYQSRELEVLLTSPVKRDMIFLSRLIGIHMKTSWMPVVFGIPLLVSLGMILQAPLLYYAYSLLLFIIFATIPVNLGTALGIIMARFLRIGRLKNLLISAGVFTAITLSILLRAFRPERFVNPEFFANLKLFLIELRMPSLFLLPNRWLSDAIFSYLRSDYTEVAIYVPLLILTSYMTVLMLLPIFRRFHYHGWSMMHAGEDVRLRHGAASRDTPGFLGRVISARPVRSLVSLFNRQKMALLKKDILYQVKDVKNIHQHLILLALLAVYIMSIAALPLNWERYALKLRYIISFFNLGLILIIMASLCSKLFHPVIVSEGNALWIIKSSPLQARQYVMAKFIFLFLPIFLLGQALTVFSSFFIDTEAILLLLMVFTVGMLSLSLVSMGIAFSVSDLRDAVKKGEDEETKSGNTAYMILSVSLILLTLSLELLPIYLSFLRESFSITFAGRTWLFIGGVFLAVFVLNTTLTMISLRTGIRRFQAIQYE